jgi:cytochrome o ubiquinol oxidase subunit II
MTTSRWAISPPCGSGPRPRLDPRRPITSTAKPIIQVVSFDWKWLFIYPEHGIASVNRLIVPVGSTPSG